jgi:carbamoyl-phosphate synthase small subunit
VLDRATGRVEVTAHNHGFAVDAPLDGPADTGFGRVEVSHVGLNDGVVEGLRCLDVPAFSVQYHPEAAAGPHDAGYLFDRFVDLMTSTPGGDQGQVGDQEGPPAFLDPDKFLDRRELGRERGEG